MPKMKTHSGAKKRFKVTGSGKVVREHVNLRHLLEGKSSRRVRRLAVDTEMAPADAKRAKRMLAR